MMATEDQAQKDGYQAYKNGKGVSDNPYVANETGTTYPLSLAWQKGYELAKNEDAPNGQGNATA